MFDLYPYLRIQVRTFRVQPEQQAEETLRLTGKQPECLINVKVLYNIMELYIDFTVCYAASFASFLMFANAVFTGGSRRIIIVTAASAKI